MAATIVNGVQAAQEVVSAVNATLIVRGSIAVTAASTDAIVIQSTATNNLIQIDGLVDAQGTTSDGIESQTGTAEITVSSTGGVWGTDDGIRTSNSGFVINLVNRGKIFGGSDGVDAGFLALVNYGDISGATGIRALTSSDIVNYGTIGTFLATGTALELANNTSNGDLLRNFGTITGYVLLGVGTDTVINSGLIETRSGNDDVIFGDGGDKYLLNTGTIFSNGARVINFTGTGNDRITNTGFMRGDAYLGDGSDRFDTSGGTFVGYVYGEGGGDIIFGNNAADYFFGGDGDDQLVGYGGIDLLSGGNNDDTLEGGSGADALSGGAGFDTATYSMSATGVVASLADSTLNTGDAAGDRYDQIEALTGSTGNDQLYGDSLANSLIGDFGNDLLSGGGGTDTMTGEVGNDTYVTDGGDTIIEQLNEGIDTVQSSATHTLAINVENLTLTGSAAINGTGNTLANRIIGNAGVNRLDGFGGVDRLEGGLGNDTYVIDGGDTIVEASNGGVDTVLSTISYALASTLEHLTLIGGNVANGTGNSLANTIVGNSNVNILNGSSGNDRLSGGNGNDTLIGGTGIDTLTGGLNNDSFVFNYVPNASTNRDSITDYNLSQDRIHLEGTVFKVGPNGNLAAAAFFSGTKAGAADDRIIYNKATGALYYDRDGTGAAAQVHFASVTKNLALNSGDFLVI